VKPQVKPQDPYRDWRLWAPYALFLVIGAPWYWQLFPAVAAQLPALVAMHLRLERVPVRVVAGVPLWVFVSLAASVLTSMYTAFLLVHRWPVELEEERRKRGKDNA